MRAASVGAGKGNSLGVVAWGREPARRDLRLAHHPVLGNGFSIFGPPRTYGVSISLEVALTPSRPWVSGLFLSALAVGYLALLFGIAFYGERRSVYPSRARLAPVHLFAGARVYCTPLDVFAAPSAPRCATAGPTCPIYLARRWSCPWSRRLSSGAWSPSRGRTTHLDRRLHLLAIAARARALAALVTVIAA